MRKLIIAALFITVSCAPSLVTANSDGGLIKIQGMLNGQKKGMQAASGYCAKFGKTSRYEGVNEIRGTLRFSCVKSDD